MKAGFYTVLLLVICIGLTAFAGYVVQTKRTIATLKADLTKAEDAQKNLVQNKLASVRQDAIRVQGKIESSIAIAVSPQVAAPLALVSATEGAVVEQGEVLAKLDDTELRAGLADANRALADAKRNYENVQRQFDIRDTRYNRDVEDARLAHDKAVSDFEHDLKTSTSDIARLRVVLETNILNEKRTGELAQEQLVSQAEYEQAKLDKRRSEIELNQALTQETTLREKTTGAKGEPVYLRIRQAELTRQKAFEDANEKRTTEDDLARAKSAVEQGAARVEKAQQDLDAVIVRAPVRGAVTAANTSPRLNGNKGGNARMLSTGRPLSFEELREKGKRVSTQDILFVIEGLSDAVVKVNVDEININRVKPGCAAEITGSGFLDQPLRGEVARISPEATYVGEGITTFEVTIKVLGELGSARLGMSAQVEIIPGETK